MRKRSLIQSSDSESPGFGLGGIGMYMKIFEDNGDMFLGVLRLGEGGLNECRKS